MWSRDDSLPNRMSRFFFLYLQMLPINLLVLVSAEIWEWITLRSFNVLLEH
jgi:hypothetical protein